ncbi:outer membrane beta-barrel protein [Flavobacterium psychrotrophum]|uniref:outer membrane beta-barrel protein n=1 Tax=Flavobacterium psychrotrophum TaxID=2294119 RepID=UPI000E3158EB|nr:outer membrane beta-barrel protein [Flavobacterium psychrotrophum]
MHKILTLLLLVCTAIGYSQNIKLKGNIKDPAGLPLEAATVYLSNAKDSTLIEYTITDNKGNWELKTHAINSPLFLKVSFVGFANYQKAYDKLTQDTDFGIIKLEDKGTDLKELVIEGEVPPIRIKQDTLEFDAASFKVRPDANVQALLKQLPGVDIDENGKIKVNGKEVNQILVNGKPFFDKDGKIALQSLPAELIKKVQVTDTKTKKEELAKQKASGDNASINLTIDEKNNKGVFGKVTAGYGTDDRYEANALINYFKGKQKISLLASSNNINATGFSNDEVFDSMGGGRNNISMWTSNDGTAYINGNRIGGGGITTTNIVGLNFADQWGKNFDPSLSYFYTSTDTKNDSRSRTETFLPDENGVTSTNKLITNSVAKRNALSFSNNISTQFEYKIDSTSTIFFAPKFIRSNNKSTSRSTQNTTNQDDLLLNDSEGFTLSESDENNVSTELNYNKMFNSRGRSLSVELSTANSLNENGNINDTRANFYRDTNNDGINDETRKDDRNQLQKSRRTSDSYTADITFTEPVTDSLEVQIGSIYEWDNNVENNRGYDYDYTVDDYVNLRDSITNYTRSSTQRVNPYAVLHLKKKKIDARASLGTNIYNFNNYGEYLGDTYRVNKDYILPSARASLRYRIDKGKTLYTSYNYDINLPSASQLLPITDATSALRSVTGNPDLNPGKTHRLNLNFNNYDWANRSGYYMWSGVSINETQIVNKDSIASDAKRYTTYTNINGGYGAYIGANYNKSVKTEKGNTYRYTFSLNANYSLDRAFTNGVQNSAKTLGLTPSVNFSYDLGELLTINPSYSYTFNDVKYENLQSNTASNFIHKATIMVTNYWPKHFVMGNDLSYTYNSQIASGFKKDFFLWNTSIGYNFLKDSMLFKVKVYDLLNQNLGTSRTITPTGIYDVQNNVLKRYMMFSLTYKINNFGDKGKGGPGGARGGRRIIRMGR